MATQVIRTDQKTIKGRLCVYEQYHKRQFASYNIKQNLDWMNMNLLRHVTLTDRALSANMVVDVKLRQSAAETVHVLN